MNEEDCLWSPSWRWRSSGPSVQRAPRQGVPSALFPVPFAGYEKLTGVPALGVNVAPEDGA